MALIRSVDVWLVLWLNSFASKSDVYRWIILFFADYMAYILTAFFILFIYFAAYSRAQKKEFLWVAALSVLLARGMLTPLIRYFYHRPRPFLAYGAHNLFTEGAYSFPSAHATFFFALAGALFCYNKKWGIAYTVAAILMSIGRVAAGVHYPSDIIVGMIIGLSIPLVIYYGFLREKNEV